MKIAFTGHRPSKLGNDYELSSPLLLAIRARIITALGDLTANPNELEFIVGMALGIDMLAAEIAINLNIPFTAAIPFKGQAAIWPIKSQLRYGNILMKANHIYIVDIEQYVSYDEYLKTPFCMYNKNIVAKWLNIRNHWMVDNCDKLISIWNGSPSGTANCTMYAEFKGKEVIKINPKEITL